MFEQFFVFFVIRSVVVVSSEFLVSAHCTNEWELRIDRLRIGSFTCEVLVDDSSRFVSGSRRVAVISDAAVFECQNPRYPVSKTNRNWCLPSMANCENLLNVVVPNTYVGVSLVTFNFCRFCVTRSLFFNRFCRSCQRSKRTTYHGAIRCCRMLPSVEAST